MRRASQFTLAELTQFWNLGYTDYFSPVTFTEPMMQNWIHCGDFDLEHSVVLMNGDELAGFSLLGVREGRGWIGGFGIAPASRGRGISYGLFADHLAVIKAELGLASVQLEVLVENWARKVYERAGLCVTRRLSILQGTLPEATGSRAAEASPLALLEHHARLHQTCPAVWQREPGWLTKSLPETAAGLYTGPAEAPTAFLLYAPAGDGLRIMDAAAGSVESATELVSALAHRHPGKSLVSVNEPEGGPIHAALTAAGLAEVRAQYDMKWEG
ncbi:MAG TPA: GNAT family N-acetyltransferase [Symbiobacteriaceae bacterium]|nr:GNAT family N-acetyltransferase [Symbiobacteriaceae bacterium]